MTKNLDKDGFCSIVDNYQLFYIDLWGVIHNGINLHKEAINVLKEITKKGKEYILLTNAPRPNDVVKSFLEKMGMEKEIRDHVFTSGQASLNYLKKNLSTKKFFHIGPPRDFDLFNDFVKMKSDNIDDGEYILCTGLFEKFDKDLNYYKDKNFLKEKIMSSVKQFFFKSKVKFHSLHVWRYAKVAKKCLGPQIDPKYPIAIAGDFLEGPSVEAAFISGNKAANLIFNRLK